MDEYKRLYTIGKSFGVESSLISPEEAKKLFPLLDENAFYGALYSPNDGIIDPAMMVNSLMQAAKSNGAKVIIFSVFPFSNNFRIKNAKKKFLLLINYDNKFVIINI